MNRFSFLESLFCKKWKVEKPKLNDFKSTCRNLALKSKPQNIDQLFFRENQVLYQNAKTIAFLSDFAEFCQENGGKII